VDLPDEDELQVSLNGTSPGEQAYDCAQAVYTRGSQHFCVML